MSAKRPASWEFEIRGDLAGIHRARLPPPDPEMPTRRRLRAYSHDPSRSRYEGAHVTLSIPYEPLGPGPAGAVFVVEDVDEATGTVTAPVDLERPALLMEDVSAWLVPATDDPITPEQQERFLGDMASVHAAFWDTTLPIDVVTPRGRYLELSPSMAEAELARGSDALVPQLVRRGWPLLEEVAPRAAGVVVPLAHDPAPLVAALAETPQTFVHGNWKLDNLGTDADGRTVVLDWELPGRGAPLSDLAWYLAINCRRLPTSKESAIACYREALERRGIETAGWWDRQVGLCLIGALVQFGWEKALGGYDDELAWWEEQALRADLKIVRASVTAAWRSRASRRGGPWAYQLSKPTLSTSSLACLRCLAISVRGSGSTFSSPKLAMTGSSFTPLRTGYS